MSLTTPDRMRVTLSGSLSEDNQLQVYTSVLNGVISFRNIPNISDADGRLNWNVSENRRAKQYHHGFRKTVDFIASRYAAPTVGSRAMDTLEESAGAAIVTLDISGASEQLDINWSDRNVITYLSSDNEILKILINTKTGSVSGYWWDRPNEMLKQKIAGAIFQKQNGVFGIVFSIKRGIRDCGNPGCWHTVKWGF